MALIARFHLHLYHQSKFKVPSCQFTAYWLNVNHAHSSVRPTPSNGMFQRNGPPPTHSWWKHCLWCCISFSLSVSYSFSFFCYSWKSEPWLYLSSMQLKAKDVFNNSTIWIPHSPPLGKWAVQNDTSTLFKFLLLTSRRDFILFFWYSGLWLSITHWFFF